MKLTPMLQQYFEIKKKHEDAFLFFRLGDFYEMFGEDAKEAAKLLGLTLTARHKGSPNEIAMCGVPHHSAQRYIAQLTKMGKRVAICDQVSDPNLPGIVQREVVKIVTPGTTLDETITDTKKNNYLVSLSKGKEQIGVSMLDLATGEFRVAEMKDIKSVKSLLFLIEPSEIIAEDRTSWEMLVTEAGQKAIIDFSLPYFEEPVQFLQNHFGVSTLSGFGVDQMSPGLEAAASLLGYVKETQKTELDHIRKLVPYRFHDIMVLDESTIRNLELLHTSRDFNKEGGLLHVIDKTLTRMGARKIRQWLLTPLTDKTKIDARLESVAELFIKVENCSALQAELREFYDLERLVGRIGCRSANARDLNYLKINLLKIPAIKLSLKSTKSPLLKTLHSQLDELKTLIKILEESIAPEPPVTLTEGGMIADVFNSELDDLRKILSNGKDWLINYQQELREQTGISTLKVKFNKVFGYHIEVSKAQSSKAPESFQLKQTLVNAHRYMTEELNTFAEKFLNAEERIKTLEYELFQKTLEQVLPFIKAIQNNADVVATLDVLQSLAQLAKDEHYCRPTVVEQMGIDISDGRHPVIENILKQQNESYIANDAKLNQDKQIVVLTGPNMAGKSSYLRQVALIVLLAHMGSFVPASSAQIGITDRIFTRVGASDDISSGQSTFMVEMTEAANILNNATERSLIIFDELGRGTSTYDGVSIAWAILEYVAREVKAMTLFATHYHELIDVAKEIPNAHNASIAVAEKDGEVIFLRKIVDQGVDRSYGIEVAKLAGLPEEVINRSKQILQELEKDRLQEERTLMGIQPSLFTTKPIVKTEASPQRKIVDAFRDVNTEDITPFEALEFLHKMKKEL